MKAISGVKLGQSMICSVSALERHMNLSIPLVLFTSVIDVVANDVLKIAVDVISVPDNPAMWRHYNLLFVICPAGYNARSTQKRFESIANGTPEDLIAVTLSLRV